MTRGALIGALVAAAAASLAGQAALKLVVNGQVASTDVRSINGRLYVPLSDVARALGMTVARKPGVVELTREGGANEIATKNTGKIGDELFTGKYRFRVTSVNQLDTYTERYNQDKREIQPDANEALFVVNCRVKNGTPQKDELCFSTGDWGMNTALTDADDHSYQPFAYDVHRDEDAPPGAHFLPGAAIDFAIVFKVPKDTKPKDLVFSIVRYEERGSKRSQDVRVSLQP